MIAASLSLPAALLREPDEEAEAAFRAAMRLTGLANLLVVVVATCIAGILVVAESSRVAEIFMAIIFARLFAVAAYCYLAEVERRLAYGSFAIAQIGSQAVALCVAIALGALGAGAWAIASREIALGLVGFALSVALSRWRLRGATDSAKVRELFRFGMQMIGSRLGDMLFHRYDNVIVGAISGLRTLGLYNQAYVLAEVGNKAFAPVLAYLPLNLYAKLQGQHERTQRVYELIMFLLSRAVVPIGVVMLTMPRELLTFAFGSQWVGAENMLRGLSAYAMLLPLFEHARVLLVANGSVSSVLRARLLQLGVFVPAVPVLVLLLGGPGAGLAVAVAVMVGTVAIIRYARPWASFPLIGYLPPAVAGLVAAVAGLFVARLVEGAIARLFAAGATEVLAYVAMLLLLERGELVSKLSIIWSSLRGRPTNWEPAPVP